VIKRISARRLRVGMHVHEFCGSWFDHPFWRENFLLEDPEDIRRIVGSGVAEVWIDVSKGLDVDDGQLRQEVDAAVDDALAQSAPRQDMAVQAPIADELRRAAKICATAKAAMVTMFGEVRMGKAVDAAAAGAIVDNISSSVSRNPGALVSLARLKTADDYTYLHSVAVSGLMVALTRQLGLDEDATYQAGLAGLLHDMGKAVTPKQILNKPGKLTDEEFGLMRRHPEEGHRLLAASKGIGDIPLYVCLHHHEKTDGSGYPKQLKDSEIDLFAKMCAVCDVYDAVTSTRPYKAAWDPAEAIRKMAEWRQGHFDERVFQAFVKSIGIYPLGSVVRLSSGRLAIVVEPAGKSLLTPRVRVFFSTKSQTHVPPETVDLSRPGCAEKIVGPENPARWGVANVPSLWPQTA
jgi:HD-GYP domain-containing protein (c-di-GMP phosphodiesterase class II)